MARSVKPGQGKMEPLASVSALAVVRRIHRRLNLAVWISSLRVPLWSAALAAAVYRLLLRDHAWQVAAVLVTAALVVWVLRTAPRGASMENAAALADRSGGAGGLLLTSMERPIGPWEGDLLPVLPRVKLPTLPWGPVGVVWNAGAFLAVALLVPLPEAPVAHPNAAAAGRLEDLKAEYQALEKEGAGDAALREELERLQKEMVEGKFDAADWEAADTLQSRLTEQASEAAAQLGRAASAARELEGALARAASTEELTRDRETLEKALQGVAGTSSGSAKGDGGIGEGQGHGGSSETGKDGRSASDLRLGLERRQGALSKAFGQQPGGTRTEGGAHTNDPSGRPESSSGGEAGTLQFVGPGLEDPTRLEVKPLPPGRGDPEELAGITLGEAQRPGTAPGQPVGVAGGKDDTPAHAAAPLLPRNRELVRRYFEGERP